MPKPLILACTFWVEGAAPALPRWQSDDPVVVADQLIVPPPRFEMVNGLAAGSGCPRKPLKVIEVGLTPSFAGLTTSVTVIGWGLSVAPLALTVIVPV